MVSMYWKHWAQMVGPVHAILPDGRLDVDVKRWIEWCPDMTTADGW